MSTTCAPLYYCCEKQAIRTFFFNVVQCCKYFCFAATLYIPVVLVQFLIFFTEFGIKTDKSNASEIILMF